MSHHELSELYQTADWQKEKHVPVIDCEDQLKADEFNDIKITLGKAVEHPNTTAHHIRWINLYFLPEGGKLAIEIGHFAFNAHGESPKGADEGPAYTGHQVTASLKTSVGGRLYATAYCNIHGLWQSSREISVA